MSDEIVLAKPREKLLFRIFSRSLGVISSNTYETQEELLKKFLPDQTHVVHYTGCDELDQVVEHWFEMAGVGDIGGLVIVPLKNRRVMPVTNAEMPSQPGLRIK